MFYAYHVNKEAFDKYYSVIKDNILDVEEYNDAMIKGKVSVSEDKLMFTTLSYDAGFKVYVDDKYVGETPMIVNDLLKEIS